MQNLLEFLATQISGNNNIRVEENEEEGTSVYTIHAPKEVMGFLIGKGGKTIRAIRSLAKARAIIEQKRISVTLAETS